MYQLRSHLFMGLGVPGLRHTWLPWKQCSAICVNTTDGVHGSLAMCYVLCNNVHVLWHGLWIHQLDSVNFFPLTQPFSRALQLMPNFILRVEPRFDFFSPCMVLHGFNFILASWPKTDSKEKASAQLWLQHWVVSPQDEPWERPKCVETPTQFSHHVLSSHSYVPSYFDSRQLIQLLSHSSHLTYVEKPPFGLCYILLSSFSK